MVIDKQQYMPVNAAPVKSFFVHMLTRDITLEDAILDLLDNCVDGILRSRPDRRDMHPYQGFRAFVSFDKESFVITDNCGGIPWTLHDYAFRMGRAEGRPPDAPGGVGVYGIGMKRAMFKMGADCLVSTQNGDNRYDVEFKPEWIADEEQWLVPVQRGKKSMKEDGTEILVGDLYPGIASRFSEDAEAFQSALDRMIATHYAFIIDKGFEVQVNRHRVKPRPTRLVFDQNTRNKKRGAIRPFIFKTKTDGVDVFLAVGFTRPIPSQDEISREQEEKKYSSLEAGWTILCNDRAVLYCDRTELTGWGEAGVPRYHTQFIAVSGVVEFRSNDPAKLPTVTTKRGIDASSPLYLQIKNKMREGMAIFTDYTNRWKARSEDAKKHISAGKPLSLEELKSESKRLQFSVTKRSIPEGSQYKPELPRPQRLERGTRRISFVKNSDEVDAVAEHLFEDKDVDASDVSEECFNLILKEARP